MKNRVAALALLLFAINPFTAGAATIKAASSADTLSHVSTGWYAADNGDGPGIGIVPITGFLGSNNEYRGYFIFDLSRVQGRIAGARIQVRRGVQSTPLTLGLWDVTTPAGAVMTYAPGENDRNQNIWNDLGSGKLYGAFSMSTGSRNDLLEFNLNKQSINDLNNASGLFTIGSSLINPIGDIQSQIFGGHGYESWTAESYLVLDIKEIPEPATMALLIAGMFGLLGLQRKKARSYKYSI